VSSSAKVGGLDFRPLSLSLTARRGDQTLFNIEVPVDGPKKEATVREIEKAGTYVSSEFDTDPKAAPEHRSGVTFDLPGVDLEVKVWDDGRSGLPPRGAADQPRAGKKSAGRRARRR
jgi:hypothetical protein